MNTPGKNNSDNTAEKKNQPGAPVKIYGDKDKRSSDSSSQSQSERSNREFGTNREQGNREQGQGMNDSDRTERDRSDRRTGADSDRNSQLPPEEQSV